jgi:multicomponent Na+:H+ antiporter subunit D
VLIQLQLLAFAILGIVFLHRSGRYPAEIPGVNLDIEWLWRKALPWIAGKTLAGLGPLVGWLRGGFMHIRRGSIYLASERNLRSTLARSWPTGSMVLWVGVFLALMLLAEFLQSNTNL